ncbi:hypothetical protein CEK64_20340 [Xanthomonas sontii]|uniref:hypothetical protein n=1 Tax=Xanthomonas sontii TaxID=2650745 RepID=UPI00123DEA37|nr:hypothetical protein [Xanthomonas sontii]KAA8917944.1 hypothetical protein CEK64_20340 [Xanthomonas sontii]
MRRAALLAAVGLLAGCGGPQTLPVADAQAIDPMRLQALAAQCRADGHDAALCAQVAQADLQRFLSGRAGPREYRTLAELPPVPASFDEAVPPSETQP